MDARGPNSLEPGLNTWTNTLGSFYPLLYLELPADRDIRVSGEDLTDYYFFYRIGAQRKCRNSLTITLSLAEARKFRCWDKSLEGATAVVPC